MIVITGSMGQLGCDIEKVCQSRNLPYLGIDREDLDIADREAVNAFFESHSFDTLIHCAAYTAVDLAEDEIETCFSVNTRAVEYISDACKKHNVKLIFISTDYVFDGTKDGYYHEDDKTSALSVYGKSKSEAEKYIQTILEKYYIVRISWAFGLNGKNFIRTMLRLGKENIEISVVSDQYGSPTYTKDVAELLIDIALTNKYGIYHATNEGFCSWADLASYVFKKANYSTLVKRVKSHEYKTKAPRPKNSRLSKDKLESMGFKRLPTWESAVDRYLEELREEGCL